MLWVEFYILLYLFIIILLKKLFLIIFLLKWRIIISFIYKEIKFRNYFLFLFFLVKYLNIFWNCICLFVVIMGCILKYFNIRFSFSCMDNDKIYFNSFVYFELFFWLYNFISFGCKFEIDNFLLVILVIFIVLIIFFIFIIFIFFEKILKLKSI